MVGPAGVPKCYRDVEFSRASSCCTNLLPETLEWSSVKTLLFAIEDLSRSSVRADRSLKRRLYQEQGIPLYWLVDCDARTAEVWTPEAMSPVVETERLSWHPTGASAPRVIQLAEVFAPL